MEKFEQVIVSKLDEVIANQEKFQELFDDFSENVLEQLDNLNTPGGEFEFSKFESS